MVCDGAMDLYTHGRPYPQVDLHHHRDPQSRIGEVVPSAEAQLPTGLSIYLETTSSCDVAQVVSFVKTR